MQTSLYCCRKAVPRLSRTPLSSRCLTTAHPVPSGESRDAKQKSQTEALNVRTILSLGDKLSKVSPKPPQRLRGLQYWKDPHDEGHSEAPESAEPVPEAPATRKIEESYVAFDLPFETDPALHEIYVGAMTSIRVGRIMEDLDTIAGSAAYKHVLPDGMTTKDAGRAGLYLVTAAVDRIDMLRPLSASEPEDLRISGFVSYTGRSSLEVFVKLESVSRRKGLQNNPEPILLGRFTMACRDAKTGKARPIPQLVASTEEEEKLRHLSQQLKERKKENAKLSLTSTPPNEEESARLHKLFVGHADWYTSRPPSHITWMKETTLTSALMMHPQERNVHGKIFGGFLMRLAYENAFSVACLFARNRVTFLALDELAFRKPVDIGSLLHLTTKVAYSPTELDKHHTFQVSVEAATIDLESGAKQITNVFHYTFHSDLLLSRYVLPETYVEACDWLEAMRRRETGQELRKLYQ